MTEKEIRNLKKGDKLIFFRYGGVLSAQKGNVFTFSNWKEQSEEEKKYFPTEPRISDRYFQCCEIHERGNHQHSFSIYDVEPYNPKVHTDANLMSPDKIRTGEKDFIETWGDVE